MSVADVNNDVFVAQLVAKEGYIHKKGCAVHPFGAPEYRIGQTVCNHNVFTNFQGIFSQRFLSFVRVLAAKNSRILTLHVINTYESIGFPHSDSESSKRRIAEQKTFGKGASYAKRGQEKRWK